MGEERNHQLLGAAGVIGQNPVALRRDHVQALVVASQLVEDDLGAPRVDDLILGALDEPDRAGDVGQAFRQLVDQAAQLEQPAYGHMPVVDLGVFGIVGPERHQTLERGHPSGQLVDAVEERHEGHVAVAELDGDGGGADADQVPGPLRREPQGQRAAGREPGEEDAVRQPRHDLVTAPDRSQPVLPAAVAKVPGRSPVTAEADADDGEPKGLQLLAQGPELGRGGEKAVHQNDAGSVAIGGNEQVGLAALGRRLLVVDLGVPGPRIMLLAPGEGADLVVEPKPRQRRPVHRRAGLNGLLDGPARGFHRRHLVGVDGDQVLEPHLVMGVFLEQLGQETVARLRDLDQAGAGGRMQELLEAAGPIPKDAAIGLRVGQAPVQVNGGLSLGVLDRQIKQPVKAFVIDLRQPGIEQLEDQPRGQVREVDGDVGVHLAHVTVAQARGFAPHRLRHHALDHAPLIRLQGEQFLQAVDSLEHPLEHRPFEPVPGDARGDGVGEPDVHVGALQQDVALDQQLVLDPVGEPAAEQLGSLAQDVVVGAHRPEGDVGGHDQRRFPGGGDQRVDVVHAQRVDPSLEPLGPPVLMHRENAFLEDLERQRHRRRALVVLAPDPVDLGKDREAALLVQHPAVLDHAALGKEDHPASAQDLGGQEGQQAGVIGGHRADAPQEPGEGLVALEQVRRRDAAAKGARRLVDEVLRDDGFEAGEVVEQEYLAGFDVAVVVVDLDVDPQAFVQERERAHAPLIGGFVDVERGVVAHRPIFQPRPVLPPPWPGGSVPYKQDCINKYNTGLARAAASAVRGTPITDREPRGQSVEFPRSLKNWRTRQDSNL